LRTADVSGLLDLPMFSESIERADAVLREFRLSVMDFVCGTVTARTFAESAVLFTAIQVNPKLTKYQLKVSKIHVT
jgi:hypothetical protein